MIDYIRGKVAELTPTFVVLDAAGVGYGIQISLPTFSWLGGKEEAKIYIHEVIREDAHLLFGFQLKAERELFLLLISVSGIGANTARMILSSYSAQEVRQIIATGQVAALNNIKGIGAKTAQRIVVELKDKVLKIEMEGGEGGVVTVSATPDSEVKQEAISALTMLGFAAVPSGKAVDAILKREPTATVEQVIKMAFKML